MAKINQAAIDSAKFAKASEDLKNGKITQKQYDAIAAEMEKKYPRPNDTNYNAILQEKRGPIRPENSNSAKKDNSTATTSGKKNDAASEVKPRTTVVPSVVEPLQTKAEENKDNESAKPSQNKYYQQILNRGREDWEKKNNPNNALQAKKGPIKPDSEIVLERNKFGTPTKTAPATHVGYEMKEQNSIDAIRERSKARREAQKNGASKEKLDSFDRSINADVDRYKKSFPESYEKNKDYIDEVIKMGDDDYATGIEHTRALIRNIEAYRERSKYDNPTAKVNAEKARKAAWSEIEHMKKYTPKYFEENSYYLYSEYATMFSSDEAKKHVDNDENSVAFSGDGFKITWKEIYDNAYVKETIEKAKKDAEYDDTVKRGWEFGSSEAMTQSGIKARGSYTSEQNTDMQRFGNPLIFLFDGGRSLSGTAMENEYDVNHHQTEAQYFGTQLANNEGFFEGLLPNGFTYSDEHNLVMYMTGDEKNTFTYLYMKDIDNGVKKYSESNAKKFFDSLVPELNKRITGDVSAQTSELAKENFGASLALRAFNNLASAAAAPRVMATQMSNSKTDENDQLFLSANANNAMQEEWFKDLNGTEQFFAGVGLSIFDEVSTRLLTAGTYYSAAVSPMRTYTEVARDSAENDLTDFNAVGLSITLAAAEAATEFIKFGKLDEAAKSARLSLLHSKGIKKKVLEFAKLSGIAAVTGGGEELANEGIAVAAELIFSGDNARIKKYYNDYLKEHGEEKTKAVWSVALNVAKDLGGAFLSGAIAEPAMGVSNAVNDVTVANNLVKSAEKAGYTAEIGEYYNNPSDVKAIIGKAIESDVEVVRALGEDVKSKLDNLNDSKDIANEIGNEKHQKGVLDSDDKSLMYDFGLLVRAVDSQMADDAYESITKSKADAAVADSIGDALKNATEEAGEAVKLANAKPVENDVITVKTSDGNTVSAKGEYLAKLGGDKIYTVKGSDIGLDNGFYAVDSRTGDTIASGETKSVLYNAVKDIKKNYTDVAITNDASVAEDVNEVVGESVEVVPAEVDETAKKSGDGGKKTTVTLISKDGLKTYEGVSVAEDTGYELTAVERNGGITIVEKRSGMEFAHGATVEEAVANVRNTIAKVGKDAIDIEVEKAIERRKSGAKVSAGSTSPIRGDRLSVGRAVADAEYTSTLLEMAKASKNKKARKAAELYSSYNFKNESESYRALGDIAKILGVSEADLVKSRAKSLYAKINASISGESNIVDKLNSKLYEERKAAVDRGDTATVKAIDYLVNVLNSEGGIISVAEMFAPNQYSAENPNVAVQVYGKRMETAFKNIGLDISVSVYYDSSENAARGEWAKHPNGHSEIKLNGAKLQGEQSAFWVVSHELIHEAESKSPGITQRMLDAFTKMGMYSEEQFEAYKARYNAVYEAEFKRELDRGNVTQDDHDEFVRNYVNEEIVADLMSETMSSSELVEVFAGKLGEDDANVIASFLKKLLNGVKKVFNSKDEFPNKFSDIIGMFEGAVKGADAEGAKVNEATENVGVQFDSESKSAAPQNKFSYTTWSNSEYVQNRDVAASALAKAVGVSKADAERYINNINSIAKYIADNKERLDYEPNLDEAASVLKSNQDYKWTVDMSTLCAKRLITTGTFDAIQKALPNTVFDSEDIVHLRDMLMQRGYEVACGICYVESTRRELGPITADFIERYKESQQTGKPIQRINSEGKRADLKKTKDQMATTKDKSTEYFYADKDYTPTLADLNTTDIDRVKVEHPLVYEAYLNFMNARGQAKPKLLETRAEYKGEILNHFKQKNTVNSRNNAGGLRLQSFSDFEIAHLIDMMQITLDMSKVGLMSQAYTKVPAFAEVFGGTGIKINLSLIAKDSGLDANGNLIFDDVEGINHEEAFRLRDKYSENVGTILVGKNDAHIKAAMADPRIDFIIPFHKSSWKESLYDSLGLRGYEDYTDTQHEKPLDKSRKIHDFQPSEYWDYSKSGDENADIYLKKCREDGRIPKFPKFAGKPGYWKLLIDFKMYDNNGVGSPQTVVKPEFDMDSAMEIMKEYEGGHQKLPVAQDVVDDFVAEYKGETDGKTRFALSGKGLDSKSDLGYNEDTQNLGGVNDGDTGRDAEEIQRVSSYSKGVSERASERRNISDGRRGSGNSYQNDKQQIRYNELSAYEKSRVNEILYTPIDESDNLRFAFKDMSISEATQRICEIIESEPDAVQYIVNEVPNFANAIDEAFHFLNMNKGTSEAVKKNSVDTSPSGAFDSNGNELSKAQNEMFKDSKIRDKDGNLLALYHGSKFSNVYEFDMYKGVWLTPDIEYAKQFADFEDNNIHSLYANIITPANIGQINGKLTTQRVGELADALGVERRTVLLAAKSYLGGKVFDFTRSVEFIDIAREAGFDGFVAKEGKVDTFCAIISADQVKDTDNKTPTHSTDTRHSLDDTGVYSLEDAWAEMTKKYGAIPKGEKAARDIKVPKKISDNKYVSRTARSAIEAGITPAEFVPEIQKEILDGKFTYERFPDDKAEAKAKETIEYHGFEGALEHWEFLMHSGGAISKENFSLGIALYNQCAQNGDFARAEKILADLSVEATRAGQAIQSMRLLKKMSADGTMYYLEKSIDKINDELVEKFGEKRAKKVKINEELARKYFAEKDAKKREKLYDELCKDIGEQIPSTFWEKVDAWRYLMMLFNPTTHIRNVAGNIFNKFVVMADHAVEGALQPIFVKQENRTRTWRIADKKTADFAKNDWELMKDVLTSGEGKYNNMMSDIDENRRILRPSKNAGKVTKAVGNALGFIPEVLRKFNSWGLEAEDAIFLGASYKSALRKIITARKLNVDNITPEQLSDIRDLAMKDALRATFREANWLAESISKAKSNLMKGNAGQKLAGIALGGVFPFTKTPMNITKQALEHSPLGVFKTASDIVKKARGGAVSGNDIVADLARTFTGTGLAVLGFVLARAGFVSAGDDEDPDKKRFDKLVGEQSYAITVGGKSHTIDWATPASIPFLVGAQLFDATSDSGISIKTAMDSLTKIAEPVIGLSMLDGLRDFMQSDNYAEGQNPLFAGAYSTLESYVLQFFPTLGGKIHRIYDGEKKNYYFVDKNSNVPEFVQELYGSVASKLPFAVGDFQPSIDLWGRVENHGGIGERLAENLISPGYYSEENYTEVDEELLRLYESTGNGDVFPKKMYEDITIDSHKYYMNAEHYTEAAIMLGERRFDMLSRLFNDEIVLEKQNVPYSEMSDSEKAKIVSDVYYQALNETKYAMFDKVRENSAKYGDVPELDSEAKIRIGAENAEIFYNGDPTGENAYNYEIYSKANDFLKKTDKILADADLSDEERKKAEADILEYANAFPFEGTRGGELAAAFYDKIYNNGDPKFDIEYGDIFSKYSEYIDVDATIDGKKYKENLSVGDYLELSTNIAAAEEILRITMFGTESDVSTYAQPLMEQYKNEPWMQIVKAASENIPKKDEDKAAFYKSVMSDVKNGIKNSYDVKYIKEASSGNDTVDRLAVSKDMSNKAYSAAQNGATGAQRVYWTQKYNFANQAYKAIQGDKSSNKAGYIKDLETLSEKYDGKLSRGDKLIAENYNKVGNDDVFYTGAESYVLEKSKDGIKYEMPMSYHDYKSMTKYMDDAMEYAALYVFGNDSDKSSANKIRNQNGNMKTWIADGLKATNSAMKGNYDLYKKGKLSADEYNAIYYKTLVGKIKSEIRADYRESYFKKSK